MAALAQAWWLQQRGTPLPAAVVLLGTGAIGCGLWQLLRCTGKGPCRLRLLADGRALFRAKGVDVEAWPASCSLRLGGYTVMVFRQRSGRRLRLLLGPGILSAGDQAALGRWLQRVPGRGETAAGVLG